MGGDSGIAAEVSMPPLPPRVAAIKRAIETRLDFTVLGDAGEEEVVRYYRRQGVNGRAKICEWQAWGSATNSRRAVVR